jgi:single-stranded-DNA-specific exonuclease
MLEEADAEAAAEMQAARGPRVIVTARKGWHPGVVGLLASRLKERYRRPAFAIAFDGNGKGTGSGRSVPGIDMGRLVRKAVETGLLVKGGGHAMAAGLTVEQSRLGELRAFFEETAPKRWRELASTHRLKIDGAFRRRVTLDLADMIERAGPFGAGHPQPIFADARAHTLSDVRVVGQNHIKLTFDRSRRRPLNGIAFRAADTEMGAALLGGRAWRFMSRARSRSITGRVSGGSRCRVTDAAPAR